MLGKVVKDIKMQSAMSIDNRILDRIKDIGMTKPKEKLEWDSWIRVSSIPYMCPRDEVHYALSDEIRYERYGKKILTFEFGNAYQDLIRDQYLGPIGILLGDWACQRCGELYENVLGDRYCKMPLNATCPYCGHSKYVYQEIMLKDERFRISGHPDGFLNTGHKYSILEVKTSNDRTFKDFKKNKASAQYMPSYLTQVNLYMWMSGYDETKFLFFNKNNSDMVNFSVAYNYTAFVAPALRKVNAIRLGIKNRVLPACICKDNVHGCLSLSA